MADQARNDLLNMLMAALEREPRVNLHRSPINPALHDDALVLEGTADSIAEKKIIVATARQITDLIPVLDRLRVKAGPSVEDGALMDNEKNKQQNEPKNTRYCVQLTRNGAT